MAPKKKPSENAAPKGAAKPAAKGAAKGAAKAAPKGAAKAAAKPAPPAKKGKKGGKNPEKKQDRICAVLIRNLDFEGMCHETVKQTFKNVGGIVGVRLRHGKFTLLFLKSQANARKALEYNNKTVKGNKIQVIRANKAKLPKKREGYCKTVWVGPVPGGTKKKQLMDHFKACGRIKKVRIYPSRKHAFIYFNKPDQALKAVAMQKVPFSHGKDVSQMKNVPLQLKWKWQVKLSYRTRTSDRLKNEKRFNRRPPSEIERKLKKSEARKALRAAAKAAKEKDSKKKSTGSSGKKDSTAKKGSTTKKGSSTKKGSTSKK